MKKYAALAVVIAGCCVGFAAHGADWTNYKDQVRIKKAIAETLTPAQYEARVEALAKELAARAAAGPARPASGPTPNLSADTCPATTFDIGALPYANASTTAGLADDYDLPADTTNPTCTAAVTCTGTGPVASLPRGAIYTGTGTAPDRAYRIQTNAACNLTIGMTSTPDLALVLYPTTCSSSLADCGCVSDSGLANGSETITMTTAANTPYFVVIDGYSSAATPPGPSGAFNLSVSSKTPGCALTPVQLQNFSID